MKTAFIIITLMIRFKNYFIACSENHYLVHFLFLLMFKHCLHRLIFSIIVIGFQINFLNTLIIGQIEQFKHFTIIQLELLNIILNLHIVY